MSGSVYFYCGGFFLLLIVGELGNLRMPDIQLRRDGYNEDFSTVDIRSSRTDQFNEGDYKTLNAVGGPVFPVKALARLITIRNWPNGSDGGILVWWLKTRLSANFRMAGLDVGNPASSIGNHSLGSGVVAAMRRSVYDIEVIKKRAGWKSASPQCYLRGARRALTTIGQ